MTYDEARGALARAPRCWLVTGVAGFIGSNLLESLLQLGQTVVGLDNLSTGKRENLSQVCSEAGTGRGRQFTFIDGDIRDLDTCKQACRGVDVVLHQAALGSVPRSLIEPEVTNAVNVSGFLNILRAARDSGVSRLVYAGSSSVYGSNADIPKVEDRVGKPLSPYAVSKFADELYASTFVDNYGYKATGLRYFNVFGPRQDPNGPYAAVIPKWVLAMSRGQPVTLFGDGETSRDFCYVANVVQANILAATAPDSSAGEVYNVAVGGRTTLKELHRVIAEILAEHGIVVDAEPRYEDFRRGDVRHSQADISKAIRLLGYEPTHTLIEGMRLAVPYYLSLPQA